MLLVLFLLAWLGLRHFIELVLNESFLLLRDLKFLLQRLNCGQIFVLTHWQTACRLQRIFVLKTHESRVRSMTTHPFLIREQRPRIHALSLSWLLCSDLILLCWLRNGSITAFSSGEASNLWGRSDGSIEKWLCDRLVELLKRSRLSRCLRDLLLMRRWNLVYLILLRRCFLISNITIITLTIICIALHGLLSQ